MTDDHGSDAAPAAPEPKPKEATEERPADAPQAAESGSPRATGYGRAPAIALFLGGFLTCLGLGLSLLALNGTIHPTTTAAGVPSASAAAMSTGAPGSANGPAVTPGPSASTSATPSPTIAPILAPAVRTPADLASGHSLGKAGAKVTVEVWEDYQCPFCRRFTQQVEPQIVASYVETGKVRLVFRDLAFLGSESAWAAVAATLAEQQGRFWPYHDYLFANQLGENVGSFSVDRLTQIADAVGLERAKFEAGIAPDAASTLFAQIQATSKTDATKLGITATPTIVVNGKVLAGSDWLTVKAAIDAALKAK